MRVPEPEIIEVDLRTALPQSSNAPTPAMTGNPCSAPPRMNNSRRAGGRPIDTRSNRNGGPERRSRSPRLSFIKEGPSGPLSYALIFNPYLVIRRRRNQKHSGVREDKHNALMERAGEISATDLDMPDPWAPAPAFVTGFTTKAPAA